MSPQLASGSRQRVGVRAGPSEYSQPDPRTHGIRYLKYSITRPTSHRSTKHCIKHIHSHTHASSAEHHIIKSCRLRQSAQNFALRGRGLSPQNQTSWSTHARTQRIEPSIHCRTQRCGRHSHISLLLSRWFQPVVLTRKDIGPFVLSAQ